MFRQPGLDHSAHLPLELKLDVLNRLSKDDLLHASSVSQMWRAAGRLDPRFIVNVCACASKRQKAIIARNNGQDVPVDNFEHARRLKLRIALVYDTSGRMRNCCCTIPQRLPTDDWLAFSRYVQPMADRLVRLHLVIVSNIPHGGLFDVALPALCDFRLEARRGITLLPPVDLSSSIVNLGAPALRAVHLIDLIMSEVVPAFCQVTTLTLEFTERCTEPYELISLKSFIKLENVTITGSMYIDSSGLGPVNLGPVNWFKRVAWLPSTYSRMHSLSMIDIAGQAWDEQSVLLPSIASLRYGDIPHNWPEHVDSFLRTIIPPVDEPLHVLLFTRKPKGLVVAQRTETKDPGQPVLRVLILPDPQRINSDPHLGLHEPYFESLTALTIQLVPFLLYDIATGHYFPYLRTLNLLLDADCDEDPIEEYSSDCDDSECLDALTCPDHESASSSIPRLEAMSLVGYQTRRALSSEVAWQIFRKLGVFVRPKPASLVLNLRGIVVQKDSKFNDFASRCSAVNEDLDATFSSDDIDKWTGPTWYSARL